MCVSFWRGVCVCEYECISQSGKYIESGDLPWVNSEVKSGGAEDGQQREG